MTAKRLVIAVSAALLLIGVIGLLVPVTVSNSNGGTVSCGNGIVTDSAGARAANKGTVADIPILNDLLPHTDFVALCDSAVSSRRMWTIPLTVIGLVGVAGALVVRRTGATVSV